MSPFNQEPGIGERRGEVRLDAHRVGLRHALQMEHRTDQQFLTALQDAASRTYSRPVLVEALRRRVGGHAHADTLQMSIPIGVVESDEIDVAPSPFRRLKR